MRVWYVSLIVNANGNDSYTPAEVYLRTEDGEPGDVVHVTVNGEEVTPAGDCTYSKIRKAMSDMVYDDQLEIYLLVRDAESRGEDIVRAVDRLVGVLPPKLFMPSLHAIMEDAMQAVDVIGELLYDDLRHVAINPVIASGSDNAYVLSVDMRNNLSKIFAVVPPAEGKSDIARLMRDAYEPKEAPGMVKEDIPAPEKGRGYLVEAGLTPDRKLVWPLSYKEYKDLYNRRKDVSAMLNVTVLTENEFKDYLDVARQLDPCWRYLEGLHDIFSQLGCSLLGEEEDGNA